LSLTFEAAVRKIPVGDEHTWKKVNGPTTAVIATTRRIGWTMLDSVTVRTDVGRLIDFRLDSPAAVACEVKQAVRRWRWKQAALVLPRLVPTSRDAGSGAPCASDIIYGCFSGIGRLLKGKSCPKNAGPVADLWSGKCGSHLGSAVNGGQWTQARKASVPKYEITDNTCQLCKTEVGTAEHRFLCRVTTPAEGWPPPPSAAAKAIRLIGPKRRRILKQRGLLAIRLPPMPFDDEGQFRWIVSPHAHHELDGAVWYFDGSMLMGKWRPLRVTGFGIAVVTPGGSLFGYGLGWPPSWCSTAAAAEAWAP
jgi:hypothetical protein